MYFGEKIVAKQDHFYDKIFLLAEMGNNKKIERGFKNSTDPPTGGELNVVNFLRQTKFKKSMFTRVNKSFKIEV